MILVADSGSTNTDWVILNKHKIISSFKTKGFNPYFTSIEEVYSEIATKSPKEVIVEDVKHIYFYGAGCSSTEMENIILNGLSRYFTNSVIEINHDLLGAARALFLNEPGIAIILGTGANTCVYNGKEITENIPSLGFILGDEGGGDYMGKHFITDFLYGNLPEEISASFSEIYKLSKSEILQKVYKEPYPNRFLASFTEFLLLNIENASVNEIIKKTFRDLFKIHICKYSNYQKEKIRVTGSVAYYFKKQLVEVASEFNLEIDLIVKKPISRLAQFHLIDS